MNLNRSEMRLAVQVGDKRTVAKAEPCPDHPLSGLAGELNERFEESRNVGRRKLISPNIISGGFEFPLFNDPIDKETSNTIKQESNDTQLGDDGRAAKRSNGRFAQEGKIFFERAICAFGGRTKSKQLAKALRASRDFEHEARMLSNRNMSGIA